MGATSGLGQHAASAWYGRVNAYEPANWNLQPAWSNSRSNLTVTVRMAHSRGLGTLGVCMSAKQMSLRIVAATTIALALLTTVTVLNWPDVSTATPRPEKTVVVTKAPPGCERFVDTSDAFVEVTGDFLEVHNVALDALIEYDTKTLSAAVAEMERLKGRYDLVMARYLDARAGCL